MDRWPIAIWVILGAGAIFLGEFVYLRFRLWQEEPNSAAAQQRLARIATALRNYARDHGSLLPDDLETLKIPESVHLTYRPCRRLDLDDKLMLIHDAKPCHRVLEFPKLREGRGVVFCSGRIHVVSEDVFDKLRVADDALREKHKLEAIDDLT